MGPEKAGGSRGFPILWMEIVETIQKEKMQRPEKMEEDLCQNVEGASS